MFAFVIHVSVAIKGTNVSLSVTCKPSVAIYLCRGIVSVILAFVLFGLIHTPDGPFIRPHPIIWRLSLVLSVVYELALVFLLFQVSTYKGEDSASYV